MDFAEHFNRHEADLYDGIEFQYFDFEVTSGFLPAVEVSDSSVLPRELDLVGLTIKGVLFGDCYLFGGDCCFHWGVVEKIFLLPREIWTMREIFRTVVVILFGFITSVDDD